MRTPHEPRLAHVAAMVADATRARMLSYLLSGELACASELASAATVTPATASGHLSKLVDAGLLVCEQRGRHRYFRLADADVAHALEALALVAERDAHDQTWRSPERQRLRAARTCYGHLAGRLGVGLFDKAQADGWLQPAPQGLMLTAQAVQALVRWGFEGQSWVERMQSAPAKRWLYPCLDWSERKDHLAGPFANALLTHFLAQGWVRRRDGERAIELTPKGLLPLGHLTKRNPDAISA